MGTTKSDEFSLRDNRIADYAKALAHPARVAILRVLAERGKCVCGDVVEEIPLSQSTVSQHLKALRKAGFIKTTAEGTAVQYAIDYKNWESVRKVFKKFFSSLPD
jgi:DNA-binding transcriptional ArsR family regulator